MGGCGCWSGLEVGQLIFDLWVTGKCGLSLVVAEVLATGAASENRGGTSPFTGAKTAGTKLPWNFRRVKKRFLTSKMCAKVLLK